MKTLDGLESLFQSSKGCFYSTPFLWSTGCVLTVHLCLISLVVSYSANAFLVAFCHPLKTPCLPASSF